MKKGWVIVLTIFIVILVIISVVLLVLQNSEKKSHIAEYKFMGCMSDCPLVPSPENSSIRIIGEECSDNCKIDLNVFKDKYVTDEFLYCNTVWADTHSDFSALQNCWKEALPKLEAKYPYVVNK